MYVEIFSISSVTVIDSVLVVRPDLHKYTFVSYIHRKNSASVLLSYPWLLELL